MLHASMVEVMGAGRLPMFTIYASPSDYPDMYVARMFDLDKPTATAFASSNVENVRGVMRALGLHQKPRDPIDDAVILETWI